MDSDQPIDPGLILNQRFEALSKDEPGYVRKKLAVTSQWLKEFYPEESREVSRRATLRGLGMDHTDTVFFTPEDRVRISKYLEERPNERSGGEG